MKTIKLITAMLFMCATTNAQTKLEILPKAAISYADEKYEVDNIKSARVTLPNLSVRTGLELKYGKLSAFYDNKFWVEHVKDVRFQPTQAVFTVGITYTIAKNIKISCEHSCYHPVYTSGDRLRGMCGGKSEITLSYGY